MFDEADAQLEASILGLFLRAPTTREALRRGDETSAGIASCLRQAESPECVLVLNWAGDPSSRKSQSTGHVEADGCPPASVSRRQIRGDEQRHGRAPRDVLDGRGTVTLESSTETIRVPSDDSIL